MKLTTTLLLAGMLLMTVSAANAASQNATPNLAPAPQAQALPSASPRAEVPATPATSCKLTAGALPPVVDQSFTCGACSDSICVGATRGQICGIDSGGYKHCNIFSGGFMCSTGGWACQCRSGVLP